MAEASSDIPVQPSCLTFWRHDPFDACCVCILCLVNNFDDDFNYTPDIDERLDDLKRFEKLVKTRLHPVAPGISSKLVLTTRDQTEISTVVRCLMNENNNFLRPLIWTPHKRDMWSAVNKIFLPTPHRQDISLVVEELAALFDHHINGRHEKGARELLEMKNNTVTILAVAEGFFRKLLQ